ncbi:PQQ-dependent sugar dehydrogenase [Oceanibacterium hippocampi]|uniref:Membrane bound L-sorbosone dehydrogenase n=1 Tax=Oceanibacterium hippocampi TaxID=745714 RepID=A0A1Y5R9R2_9PROT|nr:PQQ-dependent sugar dehydrogenase [Oceanibacterium hippocampi]SLN12413.1 Membrane bound L-sorbosone dehydrogenase [Oceanibacterium hippocampi]
MDRRWPGIFALLALATVSWTVPGLAVAADDQVEAVGVRHLILPEQLPAPFASESVANSPARVARPTFAGLTVPAGFTASIFADRLEHPRWFLVLDNGDVLVSEPKASRITLLRDGDGDGKAEVRRIIADGLDRPHGMAWRDGWLYVGEPRRIVRMRYAPGDDAVSGSPEPVTGDGALGDGRGHWTRNLLFDADGGGFLVTVGSRGNVGEEDPVRASVQHFDAGGDGQRTFADGLRNPVGIARHPDTGDVYVVVNERDGYGDDLVPDFLTRIRQDEFFGWPYAYAGGIPDPDYGDRAPEKVAATVRPDVLFQAHSAPIGLAFYDGSLFPPDYRGDAFVALRGSWNAARPTGYKIVRVPFRDGRPLGHYVDFALGFRLGDGDRARVWGRPAGLAVAADGALLVADDTGGTVWRIAWRGE